jgi:hypothetical protein
MSDQVDVKRVSDAGWYSRLDFVLNVISESLVLDDTKPGEYSPAMSVDREHWSVQRIHENASCGFQSDAWEGLEKTLSVTDTHLAQEREADLAFTFLQNREYPSKPILFLLRQSTMAYATNHLRWCRRQQIFPPR